MSNELTIPALPCRSIEETLDFYVALGFEITYRQNRPNTYGCVKYEDINLHFFTLKGYEPKDSYSTCVVLVPDLAALHQTFSAGLRGKLGKLPIAGIPRISKLNNLNSDHQLRFNIIDPGGNWIRFAQSGQQPAASDDALEKAGQSKLSRAAHAADWLVESQGDFAGAAKMLDNALAQANDAPSAHRYQALVARASVAISQDDLPLARQMLNQANAISLTDDERAVLTADFERAADLAAQLPASIDE